MSDQRAGLFHQQQHSEPNTEDLTGVTSLITLFLVTEGLFLSNTHRFSRSHKGARARGRAQTARRKSGRLTWPKDTRRRRWKLKPFGGRKRWKKENKRRLYQEQNSRSCFTEAGGKETDDDTISSSTFCFNPEQIYSVYIYTYAGCVCSSPSSPPGPSQPSVGPTWACFSPSLLLLKREFLLIVNK